MEPKVNEKLFEEQSIYVGIDCHKKNWTVTILGEQYKHKMMSQNSSPDILAYYFRRNFRGADFHAIYKTRFNGFYSCQRLKELGIDCKVVHAPDIPTRYREKIQKLDPGDGRKLARSIRSKEFEFMHVPEPTEEADQELV
jgi:transposase